MIKLKASSTAPPTSSIKVKPQKQQTMTSTSKQDYSSTSSTAAATATAPPTEATTTTTPLTSTASQITTNTTTSVVGDNNTQKPSTPKEPIKLKVKKQTVLKATEEKEEKVTSDVNSSEHKEIPAGTATTSVESSEVQEQKNIGDTKKQMSLSLSLTASNINTSDDTVKEKTNVSSEPAVVEESIESKILKIMGTTEGRISLKKELKKQTGKINSHMPFS